MGMFSWLGIGEKAIDIVDQAVINTDAVISLSQAGNDKALKAYLAAVQVKTVPWVDALHKMGRQIQVYLIISLAFYCAYADKDLPQIAWLVSGGAAGAYTLIKGKGK